jgi:hypothetical protein
MIIDYNTTIKDIKEKFSCAFPFLKIEFSSKPHGLLEKTRKGDWYDENSELHQVSKFFETGELEIQPWHKTAEIEALFIQGYGLYPQIFRKEGNRWIQTAGSDLLSLEEQNELSMGKALEAARNNGWLDYHHLL